MAKTHQGPTNNKGKLSKTYRFKKKVGIFKKRAAENNPKSELKRAKIIVRNLPFKTTESDFRRLYEPFGEIEEIKLLKRPDGSLVGCGFVEFKNLEDASKAIFKTNKSEFLGRMINSSWSIPKSEYAKNLKREEEIKEEIKEEVNDEQQHDEGQSEEVVEIDKTTKKRKDSFKKKNALSRAEQRKLYKERLREKRSRVVIRNLPFSTTEDSIKEHFSKYGGIKDVNLLKKPGGKIKGVCFIQFDRVQAAAQAIHYENMKNFQNRPMVVDWAIPKNKYEKTNNEVEVKTEEEGDDDLTIVKEEINESESGEIKIKEESESDEDEIKKEDDSDDEENEGSDSDVNSDDGDEEDEDDEDEDDKNKIKLERDNESMTSQSHPRRISNDVNEGKTVFIKNVPFSATNDDLKECMEQFGPVYYALVCMDRLTEHSKGTAFVKFRNVEDAEKCLAAGTELKIHDQVLDPHKALHRHEVNDKNKEKNKNTKDSRNLYLVKEGVILANSPSAQDVSAADMARRLQLEKWKSQMLRNLNMFVSRVRLVIQNLPPTVDDAKLRQLFKKHSNPNAVITEARVMRDLRNVEANGVGKSKEYGFVTFTTHEDALKALRSLNNNPNIFTKAKRPIVAFSIENRVMVNAKHKRVEKSRQHNPLYTDRKRKSDDSREVSNNANDAGPSAKNRKNKRFDRPKRPAARGDKAANDEEAESYAGTTSKPGGANRMNGKFFLRKQATIHAENLKQQKKKAKSQRQLQAKKKDIAGSRNEAKPKQGSKRPDADEANFSRMVNSYKNKLSSVSNYKSKWYEST